MVRELFSMIKNLILPLFIRLQGILKQKRKNISKKKILTEKSKKIFSLFYL